MNSMDGYMIVMRSMRLIAKNQIFWMEQYNSKCTGDEIKVIIPPIDEVIDEALHYFFNNNSKRVDTIYGK